MVIYGVDISVHQTGIDIAQIASEGYRFAICRASIGVNNDAAFVDLSRAARAAGMVPGAYHWLRSGSGTEQARILYTRINASDPTGPAGWLVAVDCEDDSPYEVIVEFARAWREMSGGHPLLLYTGRWWWPPKWDGHAITPYLWHSEYVAGAGYGSVLAESVPDSWWTPGYGGWDQATILQYSSHGSVATRTIDVDMFRGDINELRKLTGVDVDPVVEQSLRVAFAEPYDSIHGIDPQSWMARAVEAPLRELRTSVAELRTAVANLSPEVDDEVATEVADLVFDRIITRLDDLVARGIEDATKAIIAMVIATQTAQAVAGPEPTSSGPATVALTETDDPAGDSRAME